jgi:hypothetical protein
LKVLLIKTGESLSKLVQETKREREIAKNFKCLIRVLHIESSGGRRQDPYVNIDHVCRSRYPLPERISGRDTCISVRAGGIKEDWCSDQLISDEIIWK